MKHNTKHTSIFIGLTSLLLLFFIINISLGSVDIPIDSIIQSITDSNSVKNSWNIIIHNYRLPKAFTAILVGAGLAISGILMQTLFRNPLAGPYVLGLSSGASLGVSLVIMGSSLFTSNIVGLLLSKWSLVIASSIGSFLVLLSVLLASIRIKNTMTILIIGLMFASLTASVVSVLSYFSSADQLQRYIFWSFGSIGNLTWNELGVLSSICFVGFVLAISSIKNLDSWLLGQRYAQSLGVNLKKSRLIIIIATSLLAGSITAFVGPIAFIGLAVPHLTKLLFNTSNHKVLLPAIAISGSILMLICDSIAQLPNSELTLPINAVTSLVGAPVVIWLLIRKRKLFL